MKTINEWYDLLQETTKPKEKIWLLKAVRDEALEEGAKRIDEFNKNGTGQFPPTGAVLFAIRKEP